MNSLSNPATKPWYREPWPWLLMIMPVTAVIAGSLTWWLAMKSADGLVVGDYYKEGLAINQVLARDEWAREQGLTAHLDVVNGQLRLSLQAKSQISPKLLSVKFTHPTHEGRDHTVILHLDGNGLYIAPLPAMPVGKWHVQIEEPQGKWRLTGVIHTPFTESITVDGVH